MIASSFQRRGITSRNFADYSHQLRHFMRTTELVDDVMPQADLAHDENVFAAIGDEWEEQEEALDDSDSEKESNKKIFLIFLIFYFSLYPPSGLLNKKIKKPCLISFKPLVFVRGPDPWFTPDRPCKVV